MQKTISSLITVASVALLTGSLSFTTQAVGAEASKAEQGKKIAFNRKKGNCLACHAMAGGSQAGNIGPPLVAMKARFPNKADLRAQIYDARVKVPNTRMVPFGPHEVLSGKEIDLVTEFVNSL